MLLGRNGPDVLARGRCPLPSTVGEGRGDCRRSRVKCFFSQSRMLRMRGWRPGRAEWVAVEAFIHLARAVLGMKRRAGWVKTTQQSRAGLRISRTFSLLICMSSSTAKIPPK